MRPGAGHPRGHPRVLLEQQEERADGPTVAVLGNGGRAEVRRSMSRLQAEAGPAEVLHEVQSGHHLRTRGAGPAPHQRGMSEKSKHLFHRFIYFQFS